MSGSADDARAVRQWRSRKRRAWRQIPQSTLLAERARRVERALAELPEQLRSTFFFSQIEELSLEQVAELEGCAVGTVKSRIFRARERLRLALAEEET